MFRLMDDIIDPLANGMDLCAEMEGIVNDDAEEWHHEEVHAFRKLNIDSTFEFGIPDSECEDSVISDDLSVIEDGELMHAIFYAKNRKDKVEMLKPIAALVRDSGWMK